MSMKATSDDKEIDYEGWQHVEHEYDFHSAFARGIQQQAEWRYLGRSNFPVNHSASSRTMVDNDIRITTDVSSDKTTPSREELLSIVRKHSLNLGQSESDDTVVDMRFWREMFDMFFIRGLSQLKSHQDDDIIFFVRYTSLHHEHGSYNHIQRSPPYFVRRWSSELDKVVGENELEVDWHRSFYLNLIAHTSFKVTVAICSIQALESYQRTPAAPLTPIYKVTKTVYASPSRVNFQLDSKKAAETLPAYPDICFAVDDFDDTFDAVVLTERDHCYCVILNAEGGAAFPLDNFTQECSSDRASNVGQTGDSANASGSKVSLFSGFVSYKMVREAYESGHSKLGGLFTGNSHAKSERLFMRGPGECGEVEVAVSAVIDQSEQETGPLSPVQISKGSFKMGIGTIFRAAKQAYVAAAAAKKPESEMLPLRCCLMSISLPWETLARDLLFKGLSKKDI